MQNDLNDEMDIACKHTAIQQNMSIGFLSFGVTKETMSS